MAQKNSYVATFSGILCATFTRANCGVGFVVFRKIVICGITRLNIWDRFGEMTMVMRLVEIPGFGGVFSTRKKYAPR